MQLCSMAKKTTKLAKKKKKKKKNGRLPIVSRITAGETVPLEEATMKSVVVSVLCAVALAAMCAGLPAQPEPDIWFSTSVHPYGPPGARLRRASEAPLNATHVPSSVCRNMTPSHGPSAPQPIETSPYIVSVDRREVAPGQNVIVTVTGTEPFKGIYIQGRQGETPVGSFQPHDNKAVVISDCDPGTDNALSYVSRQAIDTLELLWKAPETPGDVIFRCTFVKSFSAFWVGVKSPSVRVLARD